MPTRFGAIPALAVAFVTSSWAAERAAEPLLAPFQERVEVRLVQVDAWATDSGMPVLDLRQDELRLKEDGKPVQILYFSAPIAELPAPAAVAPADAALPSAEPGPLEPVVVAIYLDEEHLSGAARAKALAALRGWIVEGLPENAETLVVSYADDLEVVVPRTRDRARVLTALESLGPPSTRTIEQQLDERQTIERIRQEQRDSLERNRSLVRSARAASGEEESEESAVNNLLELPCMQRLVQHAEDLADRTEHRADAWLQTMAAFVDSLAAMNGRKLMLFVSEGMPLRSGGKAFDYVRTLCDGSGQREGVQYAVDVASLTQGAQPGQLSPSALALAGETRSLAGRVQQVIAHANSSGVTVWSIGARGMAPAGDDASESLRISTPTSTARQNAEADDLLAAVAADTGGRAILDTNDLNGALSNFSDDLFRAYSIAFVSPRAGDGKLHAIRLETTRKGVSLRYRRSWRDGSAEEELANLVGGALAYGIERPGLGVTMTVGRLKDDAASGAGRLILRLTFPRSALASMPDAKGGGKGLLRVAIALRPADGETTPVRAKLIEIAPPGANDAEPIVQDIALPEVGRGSLVAVGLRDEVSGETGVYRVEIGGS